MAFPMQLSRTSLRNGFVRNSRAPAFMARTVVGTSAQAVMKMVGISIRSATSCCRSRPLRSGSAMSSIRQLSASTGSRDRNSCPHAKISGCHPALWISDSNDPRTVSSPSTTNTMGERQVRRVSSIWHGRRAESRGHIYEIDERACLHFAHHVAPVHLHHDLAYAELATDLLIQFAG